MRSRLAVALAALVTLAACRGQSGESSAFYGVRLGMTMRDVRSAFTPPSPGSWTAVQDGAVPRLDWSATLAASPVTSARFEFHNGMLVAVRAPLSESDVHAAGPPVTTTPATVITRDHVGGKVEYRWLSRECPAHKDEVARVLGAAK